MAGIKKHKGETHIYTYRLDKTKFDAIQNLAVLHDQPVSFEFDAAVAQYLASQGGEEEPS